MKEIKTIKIEKEEPKEEIKLKEIKEEKPVEKKETGIAFEVYRNNLEELIKKYNTTKENIEKLNGTDSFINGNQIRVR